MRDRILAIAIQPSSYSDLFSASTLKIICSAAATVAGSDFLLFESMKSDLICSSLSKSACCSTIFLISENASSISLSSTAKYNLVATAASLDFPFAKASAFSLRRWRSWTSNAYRRSRSSSSSLWARSIAFSSNSRLVFSQSLSISATAEITLPERVLTTGIHHTVSAIPAQVTTAFADRKIGETPIFQSCQRGVTR